jgi:hypothetical protein
LFPSFEERLLVMIEIFAALQADIENRGYGFPIAVGIHFQEFAGQ